MEPVRVPLALRARLGESAADALEGLLEEAGSSWRADVIALAEARFERRLAEVVGDLRVALTKELATTRVELFKWSFLFWVGQTVALGGLIIVLFRSAH